MTGQKEEAEKSLELERLEKIESAYGKDRAKFVHEVAKVYIELGWPIVPIEYGSKTLPLPKTLEKRKLASLSYVDASTAKDVIDSWFSPRKGLFKGFNIGIVCGDTVSALDLDLKGDVNGTAEYIREIGPPPGRTPAQRTPSGGSHFLFKHAPGLRTTSKLFPGVDIRGCKRTGSPGSHIVVYPSITHDGSGNPVMYRWESGGIPADPPEILIKRLNNVVPIKPRPDGPGRGNENVEEEDEYTEATEEEVQDALSYIELEEGNYDGWVQIGMAINHQFPGNEGFALFHEWSKKQYGYKNEKDCWGKWSTFDPGTDGVKINTVFHHARANGYRKEGELSHELLHNLRRNDKGGLLQSNHNLWVLLQSPEFAEEFGGPLYYDEFKGEVRAGDIEFINEWYSKVSQWLSTKFFFERGRDSCREYARMVAMGNKKDSLRDWVANLDWDGQDRLEDLNKILCASNDYQRAAVRRWLIGGIARAMMPGCTSTHMLILFGDQGVGKSRFFKAISPDPSWFSDSTIFKFSRDTSHRDEELKLQGKFIIEVAELAGIWKSDFADLKTFLSTPVGTVRRPWDTDAVDLPRRCVFGGTTNMDQVISDPTGGRRFAFLKVGSRKINVEWVAENRDQIWAQAKTLFQKSETWWFNEKEFKDQIQENKQYEREHPWKAVILEWVSDKSRFSNEDLFDLVLHLPAERRTQTHMATIKGILEPEGWKRVSTKISNMRTRPRLWKNPDAAIDRQYSGTKWMPSNAVDDEGEPEH